MIAQPFPFPEPMLDRELPGISRPHSKFYEPLDGSGYLRPQYRCIQNPGIKPMV